MSQLLSHLSSWTSLVVVALAAYQIVFKSCVFCYWFCVVFYFVLYVFCCRVCIVYFFVCLCDAIVGVFGLSRVLVLLFPWPLEHLHPVR